MKKTNYKTIIVLANIILIGLFIALSIMNISYGKRALGFIILYFAVLCTLAFFIYLYIKVVVVSPIKSLNKSLTNLELPEEEIIQDKGDLPEYPRHIYEKIGNVITQLNSKVKELEESKEYIETLMRTVQVSIIVLDRKLTPIYVNDYGIKMFKAEKEDTSKLKATDFIDKKIWQACRCC